MNKILVGIGANLIPEGYSSIQNGLNAAVDMLTEYGIKDVQCSSWYETSPVPKSDQPLFRNAVFSAITDASPQQLLINLNDIEARIDILDFNCQSIDLKNLIIPHPRMHLRAFVLIPLQEIKSDYIHPITKVPIFSLINNLSDDQEISRLSN